MPRSSSSSLFRLRLQLRRGVINVIRNSHTSKCQIFHHMPAPELPSLPIYREISRKYSKINPISRSPGFDLQSPAKESFCLFYAYFSIFCRRTVLPAVSHLRYTESAESSRAETIEVYPTAGSSRSMQAACSCYGITLDRGLADCVMKAVSKAKADLAIARAEEHMMEMKRLEEHI